MIDTLFDIDNGAEKVSRYLIILRNSENIIPKLLAIRDAPTIRALIDRYDELFRSL